MKLIERFKGHIEFINVEYITYMYKMSPKYYVRVLDFKDAIEVSRETFEKIVNYGKGIQQETIQHSNS